jgi:hypothetical protein
MIFALMLAAAEPSIPQSTPVTIEQVRADPQRWHGQWVEIEGWINRCITTECDLAEHLSARRDRQGLTLSFEAQPQFDHWVAPMLPLRAHVYARIDASCLVVCVDRGEALRQMIVRPLHTNLKFSDEDK